MMTIRIIHFYTVLFLLVGFWLSAEPQDKSASEKILCKNTLAPSSIIPAFLKGDGFMKIISDLNDIRQEYLKYSTAETEFRKEKIKTVVDQLNAQEEQVTVFFCGSMQFGQTEKKSDLETIFIAQNRKDYEQLLEKFKSSVNQALGQEVKFDMWQGNPIIIDEIEECLNRFEQNNSGDLTPLIEFYYYYYTNFLKMGKDLSPLIKRINSLRKHSKALDENLSKLYFSSINEVKVSLIRSFNKYDKRLQTNPKYENLSPSQKEAMRQKIDLLIVKLYVSNNFYPNQILATIEDVRNASRASIKQYEAA